MGEIINMNGVDGIEINDKQDPNKSEDNLIRRADEYILSARSNISNEKTYSVPIVELAALGAGVSSLIPTLRTVTQTTSFNTEGLYQLANANVGDVLKMAKNGNFWGAFKTADGASKFAQLKAAEPVSETVDVVKPVDPATIMMAVALFEIEQQLKNMAAMEKQILSFLEVEKEAEIEADLVTLSKIISNYKYNWDNAHFIASNHKLALDIQKTERKNMNSYQKTVSDMLHSKQLFSLRNKVNSTLCDLLKKFRYYRLSLYTFSMAAFIEILLSGNFREDNIASTEAEIESLSLAYRDVFCQCSLFLEKLSNSSIETNVLKGVGVASNAAGKFIGSIPIIKEGQVDEFLQDSGSQLKDSAVGMEKDVVGSFAEISNPGTNVFIENMIDMIKIYNHTEKIYFDERKIYLVTA